jgi:hypothetical protein
MIPPGEFRKLTDQAFYKKTAESSYSSQAFYKAYDQKQTPLNHFKQN